VSSVYYIRCAGAAGLIKIGTAVDPRKRLSQLQTGSGETLTLLAVEPGGLDVERRRHRQFRAYRVRGEWFRAEPALLRHIEAVKAGATMATIRLSPVRLLFALPLTVLVLSEGAAATAVLIMTGLLLSLRARVWERSGLWAGRLLRAAIRQLDAPAPVSPQGRPAPSRDPARDL
jgi:hypothetical protein